MKFVRKGISDNTKERFTNAENLETAFLTITKKWVDFKLRPIRIGETIQNVYFRIILHKTLP